MWKFMFILRGMVVIFRGRILIPIIDKRKPTDACLVLWVRQRISRKSRVVPVQQPERWGVNELQDTGETRTMKILSHAHSQC